MVYAGTNNSELIIFHAAGDSDNMHFIELNKPINGMTFSVGCCCDREWGYQFRMESNSDYERIKFIIMDSIFNCDDVDELLNMLSSTFEDGFSDIIIKDECDGNCNCCENNEDNKYFVNENKNNNYLN